MATFSAYNLKIDNNFSVLSGPLATNVLAINTDGSTTWSSRAISATGSTGAVGANNSASASNVGLANYQAYAAQNITGTDTYLTKSGLTAYGNGSQYIWRIHATKTAASTSTATFSIRNGNAGTTADRAIAQFTTVAQTAVVDGAVIDIQVYQSVAAGVTAANCGFRMVHTQSTTGFANTAVPQIQQTAPSDACTGSVWGLSINNGSAANWNVQLIGMSIIKG